MQNRTQPALTLLAIADIHHSAGRMQRVLAAHPQAQACFFLGDGARFMPAMAEAFPRLPLYLVQGNCDPYSQDPAEGLAPFGGVLFFYTHGHTLGVKQGLGRLWQAAHSRGAGVALYGHTHVPHYEYRNGIHLFNPGSLNQPRAGGPTYGVITVQEGTPSFEVRPYEAR